ncbi:MAG TPA: hypothetical protein VLB69_02950, partial [Rudaea sp.]|nr:hypothetical protein [Rudaea sp.]
PSGTYYKYTIATTAAAGTTPATYTITATALVDQLKDTANGISCTPLTYGVTTAGIISKTPAICWGQ